MVLIRKTVIKKYSSNYYQWNAQYDRQKESIFLKSKFFVRLLREFDGGIELERLGEPVGTQSELTYKGRDLADWLPRLQKELARLKIEHRDIHPANILRSGKTFKLIDFCWANTERWEAGLNSHYSPYDDEAIKKLLDEINHS